MAHKTFSVQYPRKNRKRQLQTEVYRRRNIPAYRGPQGCWPKKELTAAAASPITVECGGGGANRKAAVHIHYVYI
jgi:hypothetical protein